ncbi:antA/AntB antirepressor family protein [Campylobacter concisus]|jgi:hypothetical protein|uniref:antA/AntB antirepressor family protein n=1 Tax=Campylobacter concisus TaxID=199 RepID=UPI000CD958DF|nr:antA/AntB antirepressor family protein [Campylobacter concisus]
MQGNTTLKPIEIKRYIVGNEKINAVNARDLWRNLDSKQEFSRWVQNRLKATMAEENIDYILVLETYKSQKISESAENSLISEVVEFAENSNQEVLENTDKIVDLASLSNQNKRGGDRRSVDYIITLDLAKEFSMLEKNQNGKTMRRYFINFEKESRVKLEKQAQRIEYLELITKELIDFKKSAEALIDFFKKKERARNIYAEKDYLEREIQDLIKEGFLKERK